VALNIIIVKDADAVDKAEEPPKVETKVKEGVSITAIPPKLQGEVRY